MAVAEQTLETGASFKATEEAGYAQRQNVRTQETDRVTLITTWRRY